MSTAQIIGTVLLSVYYGIWLIVGVMCLVCYIAMIRAKRSTLLISAQAILGGIVIMSVSALGLIVCIDFMMMHHLILTIFLIAICLVCHAIFVIYAIYNISESAAKLEKKRRREKELGGELHETNQH